MATHLCAKTVWRKLLIFKGKFLATVSNRTISTTTPNGAAAQNAEVAHVFRQRAEQYGISGSATFDHGVAVDRSCKVAEGCAKGACTYLMRKNAINEIDGHGSFIDAHSILGRARDRRTDDAHLLVAYRRGDPQPRT
ncbi:hypothetical protein [Variovorax ginsengisoli]|uniref:Uncharacterized protein n=1 Tax=Variovorax ginsengisoli TaxID=363844 RepID=A0ABT8SH36_9BURK|nr:hypothetical protein [Variovorax ginsengisoli]MDN8618152.1 hypothetical protein [Variovorax ginsengisoli]MDO1537322.1 hypothetical protein [Variovorax ginsengisoli]